ncbi:MAG: hypothetical protein ACLTYN_14735 [Dysosmobacter welbionis]
MAGAPRFTATPSPRGERHPDHATGRPVSPRIDRIIMRYDAGARAASLQVLQGTASSTPTAPPSPAPS